MNMRDLAESLLSSEEKAELKNAVQMLESKDFTGFYKNNQNIIRSILFLETLDEYLDFSKENALDIECFCAAFLCEKRYGVQIGGYEDDLTQPLTDFFQKKGLDYSETLEIINKETIYTDCSDFDNFKKSMAAINRILASHRVQIIVFEDYVYCDCEYTILVVDKALADQLIPSWESDNFEIYL